MKLVIFGLTVSSSWGNGHATLWRGLLKALARRGHRVVFFERDVPYYSEHRDLRELPFGRLVLYGRWPEVLPAAQRELDDADVGMLTSYCPDAPAATGLVLSSRAPLRVFYDLDTPVTLERVRSGSPVAYLGPSGLADFDLVLSYTGGEALRELKSLLGARQVAPLYGSVDPELHYPVPAEPKFTCELSYLGTYSEDRQAALELLFLEPARRAPRREFLIGGSMYPANFPWTENIRFIPHVPPPEHRTFFSSSRLTLNVTRGPMAQMGYCPSGRLFEAAACGTPVLSDEWEGLEQFFEPGQEILIARTTRHVLDALELSADELRRMASAAREKTLASHTAERRAAELEVILETARRTNEATVEA